jgi:hypothetical protein
MAHAADDVTPLPRREDVVGEQAIGCVGIAGEADRRNDLRECAMQRAMFVRRARGIEAGGSAM